MKLSLLFSCIWGCIFLCGCLENNEIRSFRLSANTNNKSFSCVTGMVTKVSMHNFPSPSVNSTLEAQLQLYDNSCVLGRCINLIVVTTANTLTFSPKIGNACCIYYTDDPLQIVGISDVACQARPVLSSTHEEVRTLIVTNFLECLQSPSSLP